MVYDKVNEVVGELFESILNGYQIGLETSMKGSDLIFDCVNLLHYRCRKINLKCDRSCIDYANLIKSKKATINLINNENKCSQFAATVALNHGERNKLPVRKR